MNKDFLEVEKHLKDRETLRVLLDTEWLKYRKAIKDNLPFEEVKKIYLGIKELKGPIVRTNEEIRRLMKLGD